MNDEKVAFALGGLGGNNAHGAGFLQAALECKVEPMMISCTSGQILWTYRFLRALLQEEKKNLREQFDADMEDIHPTGNVNLDFATLCLNGKCSVFRPAQMEYVCDFFENVAVTFRHFCTDPFGTLALQEWLELFPSRVLVPQFPADFYQDIANQFCRSSIGIIFNSYDPRCGREFVYLNHAAQHLLRQKSTTARIYSAGERSDYRDRTTYHDIDADAVRDGLWLYQYGFDQKPNDSIDGAYYRGLILSELCSADRIYAVRPINHRWQGHMPRSYPEMEDLKTEIGFDGTYCGERYQILLMNRLLAQGAFVDPKKYHKVHLEEIEIKQPRGFFDYLFESKEVFEDAYKQGMQTLAPEPGPSRMEIRAGLAGLS